MQFFVRGKLLRFSIGVITAERSVAMIRAIHGEMVRKCSVTYLPYTSMWQLGEVYGQNAHRFDGLLFSGHFPYEYIVSHAGRIARPHAYFELADRDYYKMFARLLHRFPGIDITRVLLDPLRRHLDFTDIFGEATPRYFPRVEGTAASLESAYQHTMTEALRLWRAGEVDRVVTRFTNLFEPLATAGIPCELLFPSPASMLETFRALYSRLQTDMLDDSMTAAGIVGCHEDATPKAEDALRQALEAFTLRHGMALVIRRNKGLFELTTSNEVLRDITQGFSHCQLSDTLRQDGLGACVGWGTGRDIVQAQQHAHKAFLESRRNPRRDPYLMNEGGELAGPLVGGKGVVVNCAPDPATESLSRQLGISPANLQKLITVQEKRGTNRFSSADLAFYLNVTPRSANRILLKLMEHGGAEVVQSLQSSPRGRPFKIYEVDYRKLVPGA